MIDPSVDSAAAPRVSLEPSGRNTALDGLRGAAALVVFFAHLMPGHISPDPRWSLPEWAKHFDVGQGAVLIFFVLSGYVIGLTNRRPFSTGNASRYLLRRALRLVPINTLAVVVSALVALPIGWHLVAGHLLFLENNLLPSAVRLPVLTTNPNLWSLHYEVVYYLVFVLIWALRARTGAILAITLILAVGFPSVLHWVPALAAGFLFWYAGLWLAQNSVDTQPGSSNWPALALLAFVTWKWGFLTQLLGRWGMHLPWGQWVHCGNLDFLPVCFCLLASLVGDRSAVTRVLRLVTWIWPAVFVAWRISRGTFAWNEANLLYLGVYLCALAIWKWQASTKLFRLLAPLGAVSYAFYALAYPAQIAMHRLGNGWLEGSPPTFLLRLVLELGCVITVAWYMEIRLQPRLRAAVLGS